MNLYIKSRKVLCYLGLSIITVVSSGLAAQAEDRDCFASLKEAKQDPPRSERVELYYYRNAREIVTLLNERPFSMADPGCASELMADGLNPGTGVGRGGGNIVLLYGTEDYVSESKRLITTLDLPLPGIDLQLWGVQISGSNPEKLAEVMVDSRQQIDLTRQVVGSTLGLIQGHVRETLSNKDLFNNDYVSLVKKLGYEKALDGSRFTSLLDMLIVGSSVENPYDFYRNLYRSFVLGNVPEPIENGAIGNLEVTRGNFKTVDPRLQEYYDAVKYTKKPPFERFFRSQGLKPICEVYNLDDQKVCELWDWEEIFPGSAKQISLGQRKAMLEFAFQFADFKTNPDKFDPEVLQQSADSLNVGLQRFSDLFQKDMEDFFLQPTLNGIRKRVRRTRKVSFAQVGRTTISTLSGVTTEVNSESRSAFQVTKARDFGELLMRAKEIQDVVVNSEGGGQAEDLGNAGPLPISQAISLAAALTEQQNVPVAIKTGTNLTFTPGVLRNLNSAELNVDLTVIDPDFRGTQDTNIERSISRIGEQKIRTTIYTQALDFFELSTFTNQSTLTGRRVFFPAIGQLWHSIFGNIPGIGNLFSFPRRNQNVLHESLLLTNSMITPTPLGVGLLYSPDTSSSYEDQNYCTTKQNLDDYLLSLHKPQSERQIFISSANNFRLFRNFRGQCETQDPESPISRRP